MPVVKGQHYPYTAAGKKAAASARKGMKRGGKPRRKTERAMEDLIEAKTPSDRYPEGQVQYIRDQISRMDLKDLKKLTTPTRRPKKGGGAVRKYAKGGAVNLNRTIRGPNS
mgnify:CR=1 FL=1